MSSLQFVGGLAGASATGSAPSYSLTSLTGGIGSAPIEGDLVIVVAGWSGGADDTPFMLTAGYTAAHTDLYADDAHDPNMGVWYKFMGSTPDTTVQPGAAGGFVVASACAVQVWRGVDQTTPMDVTPTTATGIDSGLPNSPSVTPVTLGAAIISCALGTTETGGYSSPTAPANMLSGRFTARSTGTFMGCASFIAAKTGWVSGAFDPDPWTGGTSSASESWAASTIVLRPAVPGFEAAVVRPVVFFAC